MSIDLFIIRHAISDPYTLDINIDEVLRKQPFGDAMTDDTLRVDLYYITSQPVVPRPKLSSFLKSLPYQVIMQKFYFSSKWSGSWVGKILRNLFYWNSKSVTCLQVQLSQFNNTSVYNCSTIFLAFSFNFYSNIFNFACLISDI